MTDVPTHLPGHELVSAGLADLAPGRETELALLLSMAAPRLRMLGFDVPGRRRATAIAPRIRELARRLGTDELLREIPALKERLGVNIELASPPDFIPELPGWRERSPLAFREGNVDVHHFDPYSQALSKIERGFDHDLDDVRTMLERGLVEPARLYELYDAIEPELYRYPAIDPPAFRRKVRAVAYSP